MNLGDLLFGIDDRARREQLRDLLFDFNGRIGRRQYWFAWLAWIVAFAILTVVTFLIGWLPYLAICLIFVASMFGVNSSIAVGIKRLHDRGKRGWWLLLFYLGPEALGWIAQVAGPVRPIFELASASIVIWMIVELGCLRGTAGPNEYGPDPLGAIAPQPMSA
jgi:uncharacterized membrane protein YhaH (DUF805 family)